MANRQKNLRLLASWLLFWLCKRAL